MDTRSSARILAYGCLAAGAALAFFSAVAPHYTAGHRLAGGVLFAGLTPYFIYALALPLLRGGLSTAAGLLLVIVHAWLAFTTRFQTAADGPDLMVYIVPLVLALVLLPLLWYALREPWGGTPMPGTPAHPPGKTHETD